MNSLRYESAGTQAAGPPVIGISAHSGPVTTPVFTIEATYAPHLIVDRVAAAGCTPVLLPPLPGTERAIGWLDGLLLMAGPDIDPASYSAAPHPKASRTSPERDAAEFSLLGTALGAGLPVLGICRGLQLLNVLRNGTLHGHLPEVLGHSDHSQGAGPYSDRPLQRVSLKPGSRIGEILGSETTLVHCFHHQAVDQLGDGLAVTAWSDDGTVEAVELPGHPFAMAVQWHPEEGDDNSLFLALAAAAQRATLRNGR